MSATTLALPPASAQAYASTYDARRRKLAIAVVALAFVMDLMDSTILTIALPTIQRHMHASLVAVNWMAAAYTLTFAAFLITGGRMGDIFGYRRLFRDRGGGVHGLLDPRRTGVEPERADRRSAPARRLRGADGPAGALGRAAALRPRGASEHQLDAGRSGHARDHAGARGDRAADQGEPRRPELAADLPHQRADLCRGPAAGLSVPSGGPVQPYRSGSTWRA